MHDIRCWRSWRAGVRLAALGALLLASAAVATAQAAPKPPPVTPAPDRSAPYVLHRGDDIEIRVENMPELTETVRIRPDGRISMMRLNDVVAAGRTPAQLGAALSAALSQYYRTPHVSVIVKSFAGLSVYVGGEVRRPGLVPLRKPTTALQAVFEAGGLMNTSLASSVTILRTGPSGVTRRIVLNVTDVLADRAPDPELRPSDVIYVPKSNISVYVGGEVRHPGLLPINGRLTAMAAVFQAGGFLATAKSNTVILIRRSDTAKPVVKTLKLSRVIHGKPDTVLKPFDVLYVPRSKIANVNRFVDQYIRRMIPITLSAGFSYLLGTTAVVP